MGRPKAENPKDMSIKVRFDKNMYERLMKYCKDHNITRTDAIRKGINLLLEEKK